MAEKLKINIQNLPPPARIVIAIIPAALVIVLTFFFVYKPKAAEIKKLKSRIAVQEKEIEKNEAKVAKLPEVKKRYAELEYSLKLLSEQLPEEKEISNLLKQISDYGVQSGLAITLWKPGAKVMHSSNIVYEIPVNVSMRGSYHNLGEFFSILTGMDRIVNIGDIQLKKARVKERLDLLEISFTAKTFSAIPEEELQSPAPATGRRRR